MLGLEKNLANVMDSLSLFYCICLRIRPLEDSMGKICIKTQEPSEEYLDEK